MAPPREETPHPSRVPLAMLGVMLIVIGLLLGIGGARLISLGGSWYYLPAGAGLVLAGVQLARARRSGAAWFALVFVTTAVWTAWESGLDYWRWVPRLGLMVVLAFLVALLSPRLRYGPSRAVARAIASAMALIFIAAFALAFVPHGYRRADVSTVSTASASSIAVVTASAMTSAQPKDAPADSDWGAYGRDNAATRYSPLAQITRDNVDGLERVWIYRTGDLPEHRWGAETTPLKIGDTLYLCSARNILIALDARDGREHWRFDPQVAEESIPYTAACRGVAYYVAPRADTNSQCAARIIEGTLDGRLIAVDARDGTPCEDFGENGQVDITDGMGEVSPGMVSITSAPTIVRGVVVTGHQVLDGQRRDAPSGVIQGYDALSGELRWAWDMLRPDITMLPPTGDTYSRGTPNMWTTASGDEELGYVYLPLGNSAADYWSGSRSETEDAYATSLVALDVTTGLPVWHFQTVHVDVWDYDLGSQATLIDFPVDAGMLPALVLPSKQGDMYVLDRRSGTPLVPVEERQAPGGGIESERRSRTQPFSRYHTLAKAPLTERDMWGITPLDQLWCRIGFAGASYEGMYTAPTTDRPFIEYPGYNGGSDWGGIAIDAARGVIVANYNEMPNYNRLVPRDEADRLGWVPRDEVRGGSLDSSGAEGAGDPQYGTPFAIDVNAGWRIFTGLLCKQPPYGGIRAIDLASGRTLWDRPFGTARKNGPFGIPSMLPIEIGTPNNGGAALTGSGLIFIAAATDDLIRAIDIESGETVWHDTLPAGGQATPITYEIDGRQYVLIVAGGHHFMETPVGDYVIAYALPQR